MRAILVRHAEAAPGEPDELRPLTPAGRAQARELAERLAGEQVDAILTSPLLRARETAEAIGDAVGVRPEVSERLAPGATADDLRAAVAARSGTVVAVGHEPDCGRIVAELTGGDVRPFRAAQAAQLEV